MYYIIITNSIYSDKELNDGAKLLYGLILSLSQSSGLCFADNDYLAETLNKSKRTINYYLTALQEKKYISVNLTKNSIRTITTQDTRVNLKKQNKPLKTQKTRVSKQIKDTEPLWLKEYIQELEEMEG